MAQRIVGIDTGSHSVKVVTVMSSLRSLEIAGFAERRLPPAAEGQTYWKRVAAALKELSAEGLLKGDVFACAIPGRAASTRLLSLPFSDRGKIISILPHEVESQTLFDLDELVYDHQVVRKHGKGAEVLAGIARKADVAEMLSALGEAGVDPRVIELGPAAAASLGAYLGKDQCVALVDAGHEETSVCVMQGGALLFCRAIAWGGEAVARQLAAAFSLSAEQAEALKEGRLFETAPELAMSVPAAEVEKVCSAAVDRFATELVQTFAAYGATGGRDIDRIALFGGTSRLPALRSRLREIIGVPVEPLRPARPEWNPPQGMNEEGGVFSRALSLCLRAAGGNPPSKLNFRRDDFAFKATMELAKKAAGRAVAAAIILAMLAAGSAYARYRMHRTSEERLDGRLKEFTAQVLGREIKDYTVALVEITRQSQPSALSIPRYTAFDLYSSMLKSLPQDIRVEIDELDITLQKVRLKGYTESFEAVDKIINGLKQYDCFKDIKQGKVRKISEGDDVEFSVNMLFKC